MLLIPSASTPRADDCVVKGGRKIRVGDCALFQSGTAPPFIGIIRWFVTSKEDYLKLCVNRLYRPADVKLAKGILAQAAPNEVFYSFHKDVISADSLLHPCKVTFLREGVDLPSAVSSFVCRRVYDIENNRLWWLTDKGYINEQQAEVDVLLDKTQREMHATVQSGGRSPKSVNGSASSQQLKSGSDTQNNVTSFPSHVKGKKRERGDQTIQVNEPIKRERSSKVEDDDSVNFRLDRMIKAEVAKITDKSGLANPEGVDKLVHLMQLVRADRRIDWVGRVFLADVIAATDRNDCLSRFVHLRGLPVLDRWLQEAHKWKTGDGISPKESDKDVEELLLALLRALDKLPVSLNALQTCHIGKSVNHLRSHKNLEIQKKARSLVETWKKRVDAEIKKNERVDAEIKKNDVKSFGSSQVIQWPGKHGFAEVPHALNRQITCTDVTLKTSAAQPSTFRDRPGMPADAIVKSTPVTAGSIKLPPSSVPGSMAINSKDSLPKAAGSSVNVELPQMVVREEKSSSSSQSQNSQSCSSGHAMTMSSSRKEDARSSSAGSVNASKTSGGSSRHRRSGNGFQGISISGAQKESNLGKSGPLVKTATFDKVSQGAPICERPLDMPASDKGNNHKLIVRLPNPGRSSLLSAGGGSCEDLSVISSGGTAPSADDKHEGSDHKATVKNDQSRIATDVNTDLQRSEKDDLARSDECERSPATTINDKRQTADETDEATEASRAIYSSVRNQESLLSEPKPRNSLSSMHALIESCVKYSEASVPISAGDDIGMNLLASVATGEMSKSDIHSRKESPCSVHVIEETSAGNNGVKSRLAYEGRASQGHAQSDENRDVVAGKHGESPIIMLAKDNSQGAATDFSGDKKTIAPLRENKSTMEHVENHLVSSLNPHNIEDSCIKSGGQVEELANRNLSVCIPSDVKEDGGFHHQGKLMRSSSVDENKSPDGSCENIAVCKKMADSSMNTSNFISESAANGCHNDTTASRKKLEKMVGADSLTINNEVPCGATSCKQQLASTADNHTENVERRGDDAGASSCTDAVFCPDSADSKSRNLDSLQTGHLEQIDSERKEPSNSSPSSTVERTASGTTPLVTTDGAREIVERKEPPENHPTGSTAFESPATLQAQEAQRCTKTTASKLSDTDANERREFASSAEASLAVESVSKLDFDLNEGIPGDDASPNEPATSALLICASAVHPPCISSFTSSPMSNGSPAPITVAPAKGSFVPPENLSKKPEPGWKGSAATSAFRPAEPRKVLEMPLTVSEVPSFEIAGRKPVRPLLDIDLNVPDEGLLEDVASPSSIQTTGSESGVIGNRNVPTQFSVGLDLDLNRIDEGAENGQFLASTGRRLDPLVFMKRPSSGGLPSGDANLLRDFDLNNGPGLDEAPRSQLAKSNTSVPFLPPLAGFRMNNPEFASVSSWFPNGNSYPAVAIPSFLPDRGEQSYPIVAAAGGQRILGSVNSAGTFGGDVYRGPVLSSSPAMAFSPATTFPYAGFPFGPSGPVASTSFSGASATYVDSSSGGASCFPAIPSQLIGPGGAISSQYPRPYVFSLPEGCTSGGSDGSRKWARSGLDLNAGPGSTDAEVRDDRFSSAPRQLPISSSQAFVEEQARVYQLAGGSLKRKDPEGGWDAERFLGYKQHPRQ